MLTPTPSLERRRIVAALPALPAALVLPAALMLPAARAADPGTPLQATPPQTEGPFYPRDWDGDIDNDLVAVKGEAAMAMGQVLLLKGRVVDVAGRPMAGASVEIWQCDAQGVYRHPRDERGDRRRDSGFQGRGRIFADAAGRYRFRTIRPVPYGGRTPHIHFRVEARDAPALTTQMYVFGEERNARDGVLGSIRDPRQRESVIVRLEPADRLEKGALAGHFDIVLAGG